MRLKQFRGGGPVRPAPAGRRFVERRQAKALQL